MKNNSTTPGYSGTPLAKKLGIQPEMIVVAIDAPSEYQTWLQPLPEGVTFVVKVRPRASLVHLFVFEQKKLASQLAKFRKSLDPNVPIWVSWPKKSSGVRTTVTEDSIREVALPLGFVDVKVCAVSEVWSGLKLVVRKELRQ
ncbi:MAG: DUF3052 family protein [Planctomyces sp.]|nr:DUF3052 family protein [Planctomyces sp.]